MKLECDYRRRLTAIITTDQTQSTLLKTKQYVQKHKKQQVSGLSVEDILSTKDSLSFILDNNLQTCCVGTDTVV